MREFIKIIIQIANENENLKNDMICNGKIRTLPFCFKPNRKKLLYNRYNEKTGETTWKF